MLSAQGITCEVIAVSTIARSSDERQRKNDRKDAKGLLRELLNPVSGVSVVWCPDEGCEGMRDLIRAYKDAQDALRRSRQRLSALLLRHGYVFNEKTPGGNKKKSWGKAHMRWIDGIVLPSVGADEAFSAYRATVAEDTEAVSRLSKLIGEHAEERRWKPYVDALSCLYGVGMLSAMVHAVEFGDFKRFKNGRSVSKWAGTTPSSHASGEKMLANGRITKAGNANVRTTMVEGISSVAGRKPPAIRLKAGQEVPRDIIAECAKANHRLYERYRHLTQDLGKKPNVAKVAVANEMIRWAWAIGCMVQDRQRQTAA
jgi:transposase